jgi:macrolide-specific efflux system membrane fusion protein
VTTAQSAVTTAQTNVAGATLTAPSDGTITAVNGKLGQVVSSSSSSATSSTGSANASGASATASSSSSSAFISMTDLSKLEVKVGFSEADAVKVVAGQSVAVTFDSLTGVRLTGTVRAVDVTSTTVSNVVTYYAYLTLTGIPASQPVKPGMTASTTITVSKVDNALMLPSSAVASRGTSASVQVAVNGDVKQTKAVQVTIGLRGDTYVEIQSGLAEGDKVVVTRAAGATATGATSGGTTASSTGSATTSRAGAGGLPGGDFRGGPTGGG